MRYPPDLPITARRQELLTTIRDNQVVIVAGETGSGKSTQLPKLCLELGRGADGLIGHTQPRRLAARTIAERVAEELDTQVGDVVGFAVRFTDRVGPTTRVKVMTDGILLADIQRDPDLARYDTVIVDEAHERSLNIDFILGYLKQLMPRRPDLKVIVTSATIDTERFSQHFGDAPVVEVSGRTYPVEVRYRPLDTEAGVDQTQGIIDALDELQSEAPGDVLVFLSGEREIRDTAEAIRALELPATEVLPLYARLSAAEQHRVFQPHPGRRIVLATNVAETSLTVPGIRYVVDPGTARISRYSRRTKVQRLPIEDISQASAGQRAGRCGRLGPGICIRLFSEDDYAARPPFTEPEILRTNLASVILQMAALGLGEVAAFPFVEPPDARSIKDGIALLEELGALDPEAKGTRRWLTATGRRMAQLPLDPRLARMVLAAERNHCAREVMVIAAALSIQDPRERPAEARDTAAQHHARFVDPSSDFLGYLKLWTYLREQQRERSSSQFRKLCRNEFINYLRVREWQDIYSQIRQICSTLGIRANPDPAPPDRIHMSLLAGLLSHIGMRAPESQEYQGARGARFALSPGSALFKKPPSWVMAAELVETTRLWGQVVARIQPSWAETAGRHVVKRSYSDPVWDSSRGAATTLERVTLYGLPIVGSRRVNLGSVDPDAAREMFIHHALIEGDWETHHAFFHENRKVLSELEDLESRLRRRDLLVTYDKLFRFYDERIGSSVSSSRHFDSWWKRRRADEPNLLTLRKEMFLDAAGTSSLDAYPDTWHQAGLELRLSYGFDPTDSRDGVTVHVPLTVLNRVSTTGFDWQIPGFREELVTALIRSLPKQLRRNFIPVPDHARAFVAACTPSDGNLLPTLARFLATQSGVGVPPGSWDLDRVPGHLRVTFQVEDGEGEVVAAGKDLDALKTELTTQVRDALAETNASIAIQGSTTWEFGSIPRVIETAQRGQTVRAYPALVDEGDRVSVRPFATEEEQRQAMWAGTRRLLLLTIPSPLPSLQRTMTNRTKLALASAPHGSVIDLLSDCVAATVDALLSRAGGPVWDEESFRRLSAAVRADMTTTMQPIVTAVAGILDAARAVEARLDQLQNAALQPAVDDLRHQLKGLIHPGFVTAAGAARLADLLRYLEAMERRLDKLPSDPARDRSRMAQVQELQASYDDYRAALGVTPDLDHVRWMLEELRVSFFAQSLGTAFPVSPERVRRALDSVQQ